MIERSSQHTILKNDWRQGQRCVKQSKSWNRVRLLARSVDLSRSHRGTVWKQISAGSSPPDEFVFVCLFERVCVRSPAVTLQEAPSVFLEELRGRTPRSHISPARQHGTVCVGNVCVRALPSGSVSEPPTPLYPHPLPENDHHHHALLSIQGTHSSLGLGNERPPPSEHTTPARQTQTHWQTKTASPFFIYTLYHICMILMILLSGQRKLCSKIVTAWLI